MFAIRLETIRRAIHTGDTAILLDLSRDMHVADWVDITHQLDGEDLRVLPDLLPLDLLTDLLAALAPDEAATILSTRSPADALAILGDLPPDDAADILQELDDPEIERFLVRMPGEDADPIRELLRYEEGTAGALMTPEFVAIAPNLPANAAIDALRDVAAQAEISHYVYVVDRSDLLLGVLSLRNLLLAPPASRISEIMTAPAISVTDTSPERVAVDLLRDRDLLALPVTDTDGRLVGVIAHDDAMEVIEDDLVDDLMAFAGTDAEAMARRTPWQIARIRTPWLVGTMVIELLAGFVIHSFDGVLQRVILLASFMPVISAVSGNVGLQAAAITVRGLDTGQVAMSQWRRHIAKELETTLFIAMACGTILAIVGVTWAHHLAFGLVIGGALIASMMTAGAMGALIPMVSQRLGFDPAATAGPFETAFQDVIGFTVFLWLASLLEHVIT